MKSPTLHQTEMITKCSVSIFILAFQEFSVHTDLLPRDLCYLNTAAAQTHIWDNIWDDIWVKTHIVLGLFVILYLLRYTKY